MQYKCSAAVNTAAVCSAFLSFYIISALEVEQTWEKLEALQHPPLLAEIHHQVTHVVTGFSLEGESEGWSHCHAVDKERDTHTQKHTNKHTRSGNKRGPLFQGIKSIEERKGGGSVTLLTRERGHQR